MSTTTMKLLDAAEYRMRRGGYNAVSFRDLASDTNIKSSSVHYHYPKKEDLGNALIERYSERFFASVAEASRESLTCRQKLEAFRSVYRHSLTIDEATCLCGLLGSEMAGLPETLADGIQSFFQANIKWVENALPASLPTEEKYKMASCVIAGLQGAMMLASSMKDIELFDTITEHLIDLSSEGM